ncbi:MAG: DUF1501 domain-containing protein [Pirellulales bacterium]|nr:DUF1501 domain-containing protein [Pirellulales bacterium]
MTVQRAVIERPRMARREALQLGCSTLLGLGLPSLLAGRAIGKPSVRAPRPSVRTVVLVFLPGGPSHLDSFDPKPEAPAEVRGQFRAIDTAVPGIALCEHLPRLAARTQHLAIVRSMAHALPHHDAVCFVPCGINTVPIGFRGVPSRGDWPCYAAALDHLRPRNDGVPSGVCLPSTLRNGVIPVSGTTAGFLGARHDPLQIEHDPGRGEFGIDGLSLRADQLGRRFEARRNLLELVDRFAAAAEASNETAAYAVYRVRAMEMLASNRVAAALSLEDETTHTKDRYGSHLYGQSLLLARRLVEAGVPVIQANLGHATEWDTHYDNAGPLKKRLLPQLDQALAALLDELVERRLLDETLVVVAGEFGRTPKIGDYQDGKFWPDGRGHWSSCFSAVFAGGGVVGGQAIGASDAIGAYPVTESFSPADLGATIYAALGVDPATTIHDSFGRPLRLNEGRPIAKLFASG